MAETPRVWNRADVDVVMRYVEVPSYQRVKVCEIMAFIETFPRPKIDRPQPKPATTTKRAGKKLSGKTKEAK